MASSRSSASESAVLPVDVEYAKAGVDATRKLVQAIGGDYGVVY
jgi:hypothetical protein